MSKETQQLIRKLKRIPGVTVGNGTHPKVSYGGKVITTLPRTPSDWRSLSNAVATIKRAGIPLDYTEPKRAAHGQAPPPLPDIKKGAEVAVMAVKNGQMQKLTKQADALIAKIEQHHDMKLRDGRFTGYGVTVQLERAMVAYSDATGEDVPHRNYSTRHKDANREQHAHLGAKLVAAYAAQNRGAANKANGVAAISVKIVDYAERAWTWWEKVGYEAPERTERVEEEAVVSGSVRAVTPDGETWLPPRPADEDLHLRVLAKLAAGGMPMDEAIALAKEVREASS